MSKVRDVVNQAAQLMGRGEIASAADSDTEVLMLLACFNTVANEIALDYFPLKTQQTFPGEDGSVPFSSFAETPVRILSVKRGETSLGYTLFCERIDFPAGSEVTIAYTFAPKEKKLSDETGFPARISDRLLAYGMGAEYCLARGYFPEAANLEKKYREALRCAGSVHRRLMLKGRRWA